MEAGKQEDGPFRPAFLQAQEDEPRELVTTVGAEEDPEVGPVPDPPGKLMLKGQRTLVGLCTFLAASAVTFCGLTGSILGSWTAVYLVREMPEFVEAATQSKTLRDCFGIEECWQSTQFVSLSLVCLGLVAATLFLCFPCTTFALSTRSRHSQGLCMATSAVALFVIQRSVSAAGDLEAAVSQLLVHVEHCSPAVCQHLEPDFFGQEYPLEYLDCVARGQWGPGYDVAFKHNEDRWGKDCSPTRWLDCSDPQLCNQHYGRRRRTFAPYRYPEETDEPSGLAPGTISRLWDKYVSAAAGDQCPCGTAEINDLEECKLAFMAYQQLRPHPLQQSQLQWQPVEDSPSWESTTWMSTTLTLPPQGSVKWIEPEKAWEGLSGCQASTGPEGMAMTFNPTPCKRPGHLATPVCILADAVTAELTRKQREERCGVPHVSQLKHCRLKAVDYEENFFHRVKDDMQNSLRNMPTLRAASWTIVAPVSALLAALLWQWDACCRCCRCRCCLAPCKSVRTAAESWSCSCLVQVFVGMRAWFRMQAWLVQQYMQERESGQPAGAGEQLQLRTMTEPLAGSPELTEG